MDIFKKDNKSEIPSAKANGYVKQVEIKKPIVVDFNKIEVGELFYNADEVFMKIKEFEDSDKTVHNAISLNDGEFAFYGSLDRVNRASGKLVVTLI